MNNALKIVLGSALITAAAIKAVPAFAEPAGQSVTSSVVRTSDLDLASPAGRSELDNRLARAAREVCGVASDFDLAGKNEVRECRKTVRAAGWTKAEALIAASRTEAILVAYRD